MSTQTASPSQRNKRTMQSIFTELAQGNGQPFVAAMRDDFEWKISGQGPWGQRWRGKAAVRQQLFKPLFEQFAGTYRNVAHAFVADGDTVVVECKGNVQTRAGQRYDNDYCYVCRFSPEGELASLTEYMDTALAERVLDASQVGPGVR